MLTGYLFLRLIKCTKSTVSELLEYGVRVQIIIENHFKFSSHLFVELKSRMLIFHVCTGVCEVGIEVRCEDLYSGHHSRVCQAFATFVAKRTDATKV